MEKIPSRKNTKNMTIATTKKMLVVITLLALNSISCLNKRESDQIKLSGKKLTGFDLSKITFKESINTIMKETELKLSDGKKTSTLKTMTYSVFETTDPKILRYNGIALNGQDQDSINRVIIHYSEKDSIISLIEVNLFSVPQINALNDALEKTLGKAPYPNYAYPPKPFSKNMQYRDYVWVDSIKNIGHFMIHSVVSPPHETGNLAILDYTNPYMAQLTGIKGYTSSVKLDVIGALSNMKKKQMK